MKKFPLAIRLGFVLLALSACNRSAHERHGEALPPLLGVEIIEDTLPIAVGNVVRDPQSGDEFPPMRVLLSRSRYWAEDGHMDVVVQLDDDAPAGLLQVRIEDDRGRDLSSFDIDPLPGAKFIFYPSIPAGLHEGGRGQIHLRWIRDGEVLAAESRSFRVERYEEAEPREGRIRIDVSNPDGVTQPGVPFTLGVPFPRGILSNTDHLRLVDEQGREVPMQATETARWTKFGPVKWILLGFTADLDGVAREFHLEYGPNVSRQSRPALEAHVREGGFPRIDAGRLLIDDGLWADMHGDGRHVKVLNEGALSGAYVEHEDGRIYSAGAEDLIEIEESGSERLVLRRTGWYREEDGGREFCQYVTRYVIHRDSPLLRVFNTWIFTGDGNRDRIASMGWHFPTAPSMRPGGFLSDFGPEGDWLQGHSLLQYDHSHFVVDSGAGSALEGARAPGAARLVGPDAALYFGTKDFWQNFPSELEFTDSAFWFHNWPRHGKPAYTSLDPGSLPEDEWRLNIVQLRFAHEGDLLDFRLPDIYAENRVWSEVLGSSRTMEASAHWLENQPETANAQGIARTEEFWLLAVPADADGSDVRRVLAALDGERLRAVADPAWVAKSGTFYEMHHQDREQFAEEESIYERVAHAPWRWKERVGTYGMWIYGDLPTWQLNLDTRRVSFYRTYRARHHGWPYPWQPFARSGDPALLKYAEAATRQMIDANFCHYYDDEVQQRVGDFHSRRIGIWERSLVPWTGRQHPATRGYEAKVDFMLYAWYLTGFHRALDVARTWGEQSKIQETLTRRGPIEVRRRDGITVMRSWIQMYEATFDPWYLVAFHAMGDATLWAQAHRDWDGHFWVPADREYHRFTGDDAFTDYYLAYAKNWGDPDMPSWGRLGAPMIEPNVYSWQLTGDTYYLQRAAYFADQPNAAIFEGDSPDYLYGLNTQGGSHKIFYGWYLQHLPTALWALDRAGSRPDAIGNKFYLIADVRRDVDSPTIAMFKAENEPLKILLSGASTYHPGGENETAQFEIEGPNPATPARTGVWQVRQPQEVVVAAEEPAGIYRLRVRFTENRGLDVPVTPVGTPEVLEMVPGGQMHQARGQNRYWFLVPEGMDRFWVDLPLGRAARRLTIRDPDGKRAWDMSYHSSVYEGEDPLRVEVDVRPEHQGKLWLLTLPGISPGFRMDPRIPPAFAADRERWFNPNSAHP